VLNLRETFAGAPDARRGAFLALLGDRRMRVFSDEEQRFRVEGLFELVLETRDARAAQSSGRLLPLVAGVRFNASEASARRIPFDLAWAA